MEEIYAVFGNELPDKDTFFATTANPLSLLGMRKQFKTWELFVQEYHLFVKSKAPVEVKEVKVPVLTKALENVTTK